MPHIIKAKPSTYSKAFFVRFITKITAQARSHKTDDFRTSFTKYFGKRQADGSKTEKLFLFTKTRKNFTSHVVCQSPQSKVPLEVYEIN